MNKFQAISREEVEAVRELLNYCYENEQNHWEEDGKPKNHIFISIKKLGKAEFLK